VLAAGLTVATADVEDVDGGPPRGCSRDFRQQPPLMLKALMAAPLGVLAVVPVVATTETGDVDGGPPESCWWQVRQLPPPMLKTSMAGPLGAAVRISSSGHHRC
jgi:hypothetical protein